MVFDRSWPLLELSYRVGERSNEHGLTRRRVIKMLLPIGFALLAALGTTLVLRDFLTFPGAPPSRILLGADHGV